MKRLLFLLPIAFLVLILRSGGAQPADRAALWSLHITNNSTTVPTNLVACFPTQTNIFVRRLTIVGKASPRSTNTTVCYIGNLSGNDTQAYPVNPGAEVVLRVPDNETVNLKDIWLDVTTAGDGVTIFYLP